jgi:hypothetical protein
MPARRPRLGDGQGQRSTATPAALQPRALSAVSRQPPTPTNKPTHEAPLESNLFSTSSSHTSFKSAKQSYSRDQQQQQHLSHRPPFALPMLSATSSGPVSSRLSSESHPHPHPHPPLPRLRPRSPLSRSLYRASRFQQPSQHLPEPIAILPPVVSTIPLCFFGASALEARHHEHSLTHASSSPPCQELSLPVEERTRMTYLALMTLEDCARSVE